MARRERLDGVAASIGARADALAASEGDRERLERATTDLAAFAATLREGLAQLDFAGRERLVRLLVERVVVTGDQVTIEHVIPLSGRLELSPAAYAFFSALAAEVRPPLAFWRRPRPG